MMKVIAGIACALVVGGALGAAAVTYYIGRGFRRSM
jgi:hypothetical protein